MKVPVRLLSARIPYLPRCRYSGPVVIGANCLIGNYAFIRPGTIISNGVKIGFATEIKNAVIEAEATIGPQCFIADSVVKTSIFWAHNTNQ